MCCGVGRFLVFLSFLLLVKAQNYTCNGVVTDENNPQVEYDGRCYVISEDGMSQQRAIDECHSQDEVVKFYHHARVASTKPIQEKSKSLYQSHSWSWINTRTNESWAHPIESDGRLYGPWEPLNTPAVTENCIIIYWPYKIGLGDYGCIHGSDLNIRAVCQYGDPTPACASNPCPSEYLCHHLNPDENTYGCFHFNEEMLTHGEKMMIGSGVMDESCVHVGGRQVNQSLEDTTGVWEWLHD